MKITHLKLKDFGPHKHLDIDLSANIVGIIGPNGSGKSNLLQAINYALTGDLNKTNQVKYIRNFGMEDGAKKAVVELTFEKGGQEGKIVREIGASSSKRCLTWEGEEYRKQDDVDRVLSGIVDADKAVLTNAVFIKQGNIASMVQGTPSERQDIFQKLMHLSFIGKLDNDITSKIAQLQAGIVDYGPQIALLQEQLQNDSDEYEDLLKRTDTPVKEPALRNAIENLARLSENHSVAVTEHSSAISRFVEAEASLNSAIGNTDIDSLRTEVQDLADRIQLMREAGRIAVAVDAAASNVAAATNAYVEAKVAYEEAKAAFKEIDEELIKSNRDAASKAIVFLYNKKEAEEAQRKAQQEFDAGTLAEQKASEAVERAVEELTTRGPDLEEQIDTFKQKMELLRLKRELVRLGVDGVCPLCGSSLVNHNIIEESVEKEWLEVCAQAAPAKKELETLRQRASDANAQLLSCSFELQGTKARVFLTKQEAEKWKEWPFEGLPEDEIILTMRKESADKALAELRNQQLSLATKSAALEAAKDTLAKEQERQDAEHAAMTALGFASAEEAQREYKKLQSTVTEYDTLNTKLGKLDALVNAKARARRAVDEAAEGVELLRREINATTHDDETLKAYFEHWQTVFPEEGEFNAHNRAHIKSLSGLFSEEIGQYNAVVDHMRTLSGNMDATKAKLEGLLEDQSKNERRVALVNDLQQVRDVVGKNGAPKDYCAHVFRQITDVVQNLLVQMGANFTVSPDPDRDMTYNFVRTDNDDGYEMGQERLSGGQAIRLAMALLIACQQMVLPEVGLLVLDEPSSHIDSEGVANMRDMMLSLGQLLESADMQLIIVDHHETLNAAFGKTIKLDALRDA